MDTNELENTKNIEMLGIVEDREVPKKEFKIEAETLILASAMIDKMGIKDSLKNLEINTGDPKKDQEELGKELMVLLITNLHKAKEELYNLISSYKKIDIEAAKHIDIIEFLKEIFAIPGLKDFL